MKIFMAVYKKAEVMLVLGIVFCFFGVATLIYIEPYFYSEKNSILNGVSYLIFLIGLLLTIGGVVKGWINFFQSSVDQKRSLNPWDKDE